MLKIRSKNNLFSNFAQSNVTLLDIHCVVKFTSNIFLLCPLAFGDHMAIVGAVLVLPLR